MIKKFNAAVIGDEGLEVREVGIPLKHNQKLLGSVAVDSGGLVIVDPCYLSKWKDGEYGDDTEACELRDGEERGGEILVSGIAGMGVSFSSGYGDGSYPVVATYEDGRIKKIEILFF